MCDEVTGYIAWYSGVISLLFQELTVSYVTKWWYPEIVWCSHDVWSKDIFWCRFWVDLQIVFVMDNVQCQWVCKVGVACDSAICVESVHTVHWRTSYFQSWWLDEGMRCIKGLSKTCLDFLLMLSLMLVCPRYMARKMFNFVYFFLNIFQFLLKWN